jgi:hypothetical protein
MDLQAPTSDLDTTKLFSLISLGPTTQFDKEEYTEERDVPEYTEPHSADELNSDLRVSPTEGRASARWMVGEMWCESWDHLDELLVEEMESCTTPLQFLPLRIYTRKHLLIALSLASHFRIITFTRSSAFPIKRFGLTSHRRRMTLPQRK